MQKSYIGVIPIDPNKLNPGFNYIVEMPTGSRVIQVGLLSGNAMALWVASPYTEGTTAAQVEQRRFWIVPGGFPLDMDLSQCAYHGTVILDENEKAQDWHVFSDIYSLMGGGSGSDFKLTIH